MILKPGDEALEAAAAQLERQLVTKGLEALIDDRDERPGAKFADMDLIGLPWQVVLGPRGLERGMAEVKNRATGEKQEVALDQVAALIGA